MDKDTEKNSENNLAYIYKEDSFDLENEKHFPVNHAKKNKNTKIIVYILNILIFILVLVILFQVYHLALYYYGIYLDKKSALNLLEYRLGI